MVIGKLLSQAGMELKSAGIPNARLDASVLLCYTLKCDRVKLIINENKEVSSEIEMQYMNYIDMRKNDMPIAYIMKNKEFMSLDFYVDENVLIPRPDTETLVTHVINSDVSKKYVLDLCSGSGCVGISIAHYCAPQLVAFADISESALAISKKNAENILKGKCETRFFQTDILNENICGKYDVIVSNPPYIETNVIKTLDKTVAEYEPYIALNGGDDGLDFYRCIAQKSKSNLNPNGMLAFEIGFNQADSVIKILENNGFSNITTQCDLSDLRRVVSGRYNV